MTQSRESSNRRGVEKLAGSLPPIVSRPSEVGKPRERKKFLTPKGKMGREEEGLSRSRIPCPKDERRKDRGMREGVDFPEFAAIASPGTRRFARCGASAIKFRGLTRCRYARSTKADNSIPHRSRSRREERLERHGVVFRRGSPSFASTRFRGIQFAIPPRSRQCRFP